MNTFVQGIKDEIFCCARRDNVSAFNLENAVGTGAHFMVGYGLGQLLRSKKIIKCKPLFTLRKKNDGSSSSVNAQTVKPAMSEESSSNSEEFSANIRDKNV